MASIGDGYVACMKRNTSVNIRMTEQLRDELQKLADENRRTLSDFIRLLLEERVEAERARRERRAEKKR